METISNTACTKCQHCGEWTNYADDEHYKALATRLAESEARAERLATAIRNHQAKFPDQPLDCELELWAHIDAAIAQEAEREAASA